MPGSYTPNFHLKRLGPGEKLSDESYKYTTQDRDLIDLLLQIGASTHHHSGAAASSSAPPAPELRLHTTGGTIPAGQRVFYKIALVDPNGIETVASPERYIDTAPAVIPPGAPALELVGTGGILMPGNYYYVLTAYFPTNTQETTPGVTQFVHIAAGTTNEIVLHFPSPPVGAAGYNIYRQKPGNSGLLYLASVAITGGVTPGNYVDDGSVTEDCDRRPPNANGTESSNSIDVQLVGATPAVPAGFTWKIYRTYAPNNYQNSVLHHVVEETFTGSGIITPIWVDTGGGTTTGQPQDSSVVPASPSKISLTSMAEAEGRLPLAGVQDFPQVVSFAMTGVLAVTDGKVAWICEYPRATIVGVRIGLGKGYTPAATPVIADVNVGVGLNPGSYASIFSGSGVQPRIAVGDQMGAIAVPDVTTNLTLGDSLTVDIDQAGGGATPTDYDLMVNIMLLVQFDNAVSNGSWS